MNFKVLIFLTCLCIGAIYGYKLGNTHESLTEDESTREKRQTCVGCNVGPPSGSRYNYNNRRAYPTYNGYNSRGYNSYNGYNGYKRPNNSKQNKNNYNSRYNNGAYNGYNAFSPRSNPAGGSGCQCVGNTCYGCSIGK